MSPRTPRRPGRRALIAAPVVAGAAAVVAAVVLVPGQAIGAVDLPDKTPQELIEFVEASDVDQLSGTIEQTTELGLPDLSDVLGGDGRQARGSDPADIDDLLALATGSFTAKLYLDGDRGRLQVLDQLAERNVYIDGDAGATWFVDSETNTATKLVAPDAAELDELTSEVESQRETAQPLPTPDAMLRQSLAAFDETTDISVGTDGRVAGRDVYELVIEPRTDDTLVGSIRFSVDGENGLPLAASVTARGADAPAISVAFTDVTFAAPDPSALEFEPGAGVTVAEKQIALPTPDDIARWGSHARADGPETGTDAGPTVYGEGWSAVVELAGGEDGGAALGEVPAEQRRMLESVTTAVDGGRVLSTSLATVLFTDDGRVLAGAVPADRLVEAAATGR